jgi:hypothetical protein
VLPAGVNADECGKPTAGAGACADDDDAVRWDEEDTPPSILRENYRMELA